MIYVRVEFVVGVGMDMFNIGIWIKEGFYKDDFSRILKMSKIY